MRVSPHRAIALAAVVGLVLTGCTAAVAGEAQVVATVPPSTTTLPPPTTAPLPPTTAPPPTTVPPSPEPDPGPPFTELTRDLSRGATGDDVAMVQQRLHDLGFDPGPVDGKFGVAMMQAVWAYQHLAGVPGGQADGVVNALWWFRMQQPLGLVPKRPDAGPTHVEIDKDAQVMVVWKDGVPALITHISTGSEIPYCERGVCGNAVTPRGEYTFTRRISGWRTSRLGRLYNPVYFVGGIAVHGAPEVPNRPASHGCVRIPMHIAEYFPSLVANGDRVLVFEGGVTGVEPAPAVAPAPDAPAEPVVPADPAVPAPPVEVSA